jgi:hypothetical protein
MVRAWASRLAACGLSAAAACTPDFQSPSQVTDLRVLAIRQESDGGFADAFVDLSARTVETVQVKALVVDPNPSSALVVHGRVCSPTETGRCDTPDLPPIGSAQRAAEQQPVFKLDVAADVIAQALQSDDLKGFGGVRVQFSLTADDGDRHGPAMASKILLYTAAQESMRNHNPEIVALKITQGGVDVATVLPGGTFPVTAGVEYGLRPVLGSGGAGIEEYDTVDLSGNLIHLREEPRYSFFATTGVDFDRDDADEPLPGQPQPENGIARFTPGANCGSIWVVARDGRGGIGWISVSCTATAP